MLKEKLWSSEKSQVLGDESRRLIDGLSKKENDISDSDISESKYISYIWGNEFTLALKEYFISPWNYALWQCSKNQHASLAHRELQCCASQEAKTWCQYYSWNASSLNENPFCNNNTFMFSLSSYPSLLNLH